MAITRGVLSRTIGSKTIVNIQEVTNDESPPVVTNGNTQSINAFEGEVFDTIGIANLQASDRLGFNWSRASGPSEISINSTTGQINSSKAVSQFASWNNDGADVNPVLRATDTAGNFADVDLTINPTYGASFASWASAAVTVSETHNISYNLTNSATGNGNVPVALKIPFTESDFSGYFDQLNLTSDQGSSSGGISGYGSVFCTLSSIGDDSARQNLRISHTGSAGSKSHNLLSHNQNVTQSDAQSDWVEGASVEAVFAAVPDNFYYYEVITHLSTTGYNDQFVDADGQNPEAFRSAPNNCIRVLHSSKADECVISTGQIVNIGATYGITGTSTLLQMPAGLLNARNITSSYQAIGNTYYAINNGDGTISFATSLANATATPPVKVAWSNNDWGGTSDSNAARTSIRIRPSAIRKHVYNISNKMDVSYVCPAATLFGTQNWTDYSSNADAFYYKPDRDAGQITIANFTLTGGVAGQLNVSSPFASASGLTLSATGTDTFALTAAAGATANPSGNYVITLEDAGAGRHTKTMNITGVDEITIDQTSISVGEGYSTGVVHTPTMSGGNGALVFGLSNPASQLVNNNITINANTGAISLNAGLAGGQSGTVNMTVTDSKGFSETFALTISVASSFALTVNQSNSSPSTNYLYYGHQEGYPNGPSGLRTGSTSPDPIANGGTHLMPSTNTHIFENMFYQTAPTFGSQAPVGDHSLRKYHISIAYNSSDTAMQAVVKGDLGSTVTVTDGTKTMTLNVSAATFTANGSAYSGGSGGRNRYHRWAWSLPNTQDAIDLFANISSRGGTPGTPNTGPMFGSSAVGLGTYTVTID